MIGLAFFHWRYSMPQNHMQIRHLRHTKRVFCLFSRSTYRTVHCDSATVFLNLSCITKLLELSVVAHFPDALFSLSIFLSISSERSNFFPFYLHWFFVFDAIKSIAMHSEISEMKELHRKLFLGDISTFD